MSRKDVHIAGRYNKYLRNLSQSPWIVKNDVRIKDSVQELIEDGLKIYLNFGKLVFSSSGREDVDVRMLGNGRPFVFKVIEPQDVENFNQDTMNKIQSYINKTCKNKIRIRDLQLVTKEDVTNNLKDGQEFKSKNYRALCCSSRKLTQNDLNHINGLKELDIEQKTPIRVLHRRTLASRRRKIHTIGIEPLDQANFESFGSVPIEEKEHLFVVNLNTEAGTYIKEFVHGDFGRTSPSLSKLLTNCDTDIIELDVMNIDLDWPPKLKQDHIIVSNMDSTTTTETDISEKTLADYYKKGLDFMNKASGLSRGDARQDCYLQSKKSFETASSLIESLGLFSDNETIEDVSTNDLRYLLVPAYLAKVIISSELGPDRIKTLSAAEEWIGKFLTRLSHYGFGDKNLQSNNRNNNFRESLQDAARGREEKIANFKKMKLLESQLDELERIVASGQEVDDEVARDYYLKLMNKWIVVTLESLEREVKPALMFERNRIETTSTNNHPNHGTSQYPEPSSSSSKSVQKVKPPFGQPITIVKNELQKQVYGLGYPSRPTVTVDEFIGKKIADGELVFDAHKEIYANSLQRYAQQPNLRQEQEEASDEDREAREDRHDDAELDRKRCWDEFKDENPRGSGNRHNMG